MQYDRLSQQQLGFLLCLLLLLFCVVGVLAEATPIAREEMACSVVQ